MVPTSISTSVIIPAFNSHEILKKCIDSILSQTINRNQFEIIVVDDGSTDNTVNIAKESGVDEVLEIKHAGQGSARNCGARHARADIIAFIDSDCQAKKDWLEIILKELQTNDAIAGSLHNGINNMISWSEYLLEFSDFDENLKRSPINFASGANQAYKKNDFLSTIGFKEDLNYSEDVFFGKTFSDIGKRIIFVPEIQVSHYGRRNLKKFLNNMKKFGERSYNDSRIHKSSYTNLTSAKWKLPIVFVFKLTARLKRAYKAKRLCLFFICFPIIFLGTIYFCNGIWIKLSFKGK